MNEQLKQLQLHFVTTRIDLLTNCCCSKLKWCLNKWSINGSIIQQKVNPQLIEKTEELNQLLSNNAEPFLGPASLLKQKWALKNMPVFFNPIKSRQGVQQLI